MVKKILSWTFIGAFIAADIYIVIFIYEIMTWDAPYSSKKELIANYQEKHAQLFALKTYFKSIVPDSLKVDIEFEDNNIDLKVYRKPADAANTFRYAPLFQEWDIDPQNYQPDSHPTGFHQDYTFAQTLEILHWNSNTFRTIKHYLDQANCISVTNGEPAQIGFRRSGLGMYFYNLFDQSLTDSLKPIYNDSCTHILFNDKVVLEYGGGAVGPQCFPDAKE